MMNTDPLIRQVMERPPTWLPQRPKRGDIVVSSRIRLARNLHGFPFPLNASPSVRGEVANDFFEAVTGTGYLPLTKQWKRSKPETGSVLPWSL